MAKTFSGEKDIIFLLYEQGLAEGCLSEQRGRKNETGIEI